MTFNPDTPEGWAANKASNDDARACARIIRQHESGGHFSYYPPCPLCQQERPRDPNFYPTVRNAAKTLESMADYRKRMGLS